MAFLLKFVRVGMVCNISFMEGQLKFLVSSVALPEGPGIGRVIFSAMNKEE